MKWLGDTPVEAISQSMHAGLDLEYGWYYSSYGVEASEKGMISEREIDKALSNLYVVLMRFGYFDGSPSYMSLGKPDICAQQHIELAAEAAREGIVLLKNDNSLPLNTNTHKNIAVIGPHANAIKSMLGNYAGIPCKYTSPKDGLSAFGKVTYEKGCADVACKSDSFIFSAMEAAKKADANVVVVGLDLSIEAEFVDRLDLLLPGYQTQLVNQVASVAKGPVILVLMCSGSIDVSFAKNNPNIGAILWIGYPGEEGGRAIGDIVFGKYNPGGKLPTTWYPADYVNALPMSSMQLRPNDELGYPGRTYKFYNGTTVFPFGYGMSYTNFSYEITSPGGSIDIKLQNNQHCRDVTYEEDSYRLPCSVVLVDDVSCDAAGYEFEVVVRVRNNGTIDGNNVVMVYSKFPVGILRTHQRQLIGFERIFLN